MGGRGGMGGKGGSTVSQRSRWRGAPGRKAFALAVSASVVVLVGAIVAVAATSSARSSKDLASRHGSSVAVVKRSGTAKARQYDGATLTSSVTVPFGVPQGVTVMGVLGSNTGGGVWALGESTTAVVVLYWDSSTGGLVESQVSGIAGSAGLLGAAFGMTEDPAGDLWLGFNQSLVEFSQSGRQLATVEVPSPTDSALAEAGMPQNVKGVHSIYALATLPDGDIVLASTTAAALQLFSPSSGQLSDVALPSGASTVATLDGSGELAVSGSGSISVVLCQFEGENCKVGTDAFDGSSWLSKTVNGSVNSVFSDGTKTAFVAATVSRKVRDGRYSIDYAGFNIVGATGEAPDGALVTADRYGLHLIGTNGTTRTIDLGQGPPLIGGISPPPPSPNGGGASTATSRSQPPLAVTSLSVDRQGDVFLVVQGTSTFVAEVASARL